MEKMGAMVEAHSHPVQAQEFMVLLTLPGAGVHTVLMGRMGPKRPRRPAAAEAPLRRHAAATSMHAALAQLLLLRLPAPCVHVFAAMVSLCFLLAGEALRGVEW